MKKAPNMINEYNRLFGNTNRNLLKEVRSDMMHIVEDIFFLWDEFFDNDRQDIAGRNTQDPDDGAYYQFIFEPDDLDAMADFEDAAREILDKAHIKYDLSSDGHLRIWDEDAETDPGLGGKPAPAPELGANASEREIEKAAREHFSKGINLLRKHNGYDNIEIIFKKLVQGFKG
jgi:hypothetical protein